MKEKVFYRPSIRVSSENVQVILQQLIVVSRWESRLENGIHAVRVGM